ncbi:hypothetical protein TKK_0015145 [Trichogramma kaykai]
MSSSSDIPSRFKRMVKGNAYREQGIVALAEILGTATLVLIGCMGCVGGFLNLPIPSHIQITLNFGFAVMIVIQCFGHLSHAHVNPAMTLVSVVLGIKTVREGLVYFVAQTIGAILGFGLLKAVTPAGNLRASANASLDTFCVTDLHSDVSPIQGLLVEGIATAILALIACAVWDPRNARNTDSTPVKFGMSVTALAISCGPYTGCSMNPVRTLAPAIWNNYWGHHWVYWLGPFGGALLASLAYKVFFSVQNNDNEDMNLPENVALNSVDTHQAKHM